MNLLLSFLFLFLFAGLHAQNDEAELEKALFDLPGVQFKKLSKPNDKALGYLLTIKQPLDHLSPARGSFYQLAALTHKGFNKPVVMETEGYELYYGGNELEKMPDANNIDIEHRCKC